MVARRCQKIKKNKFDDKTVDDYYDVLVKANLIEK